MRFCVLGTGSKGNCTFVDGNGTRILIDAGLSARGIAQRLAMIDVEPETIDAIVISHEHSDHIKGIDVWCKRFGTTIYASSVTHKAFSKLIGRHVRVEHLRGETPVELGSLRIRPFQVMHDAADPVGFLLESNGSRMGIATDLGCATTLVRECLQGLDALILESNHDMRMLIEGPYPWPIKDRIRRNHGHLSNEQSGKLLTEVVHKGLKTVVLAHLSEINNRPELAHTAAKDALGRKSSAFVSVGWQDRISQIIVV